MFIATVSAELPAVEAAEAVRAWCQRRPTDGLVWLLDWPRSGSELLSPMYGTSEPMYDTLPPVVFALRSYYIT